MHRHDYTPEEQTERRLAMLMWRDGCEDTLSAFCEAYAKVLEACGTQWHHLYANAGSISDMARWLEAFDQFLATNPVPEPPNRESRTGRRRAYIVGNWWAKLYGQSRYA